LTLPDSEEAFSEKTSIFFAKRIDGSPANLVSAVPIMAWPK